jgi:hypothetical protein
MRVGSIPTDAPISLSQKTKTQNMEKTTNALQSLNSEINTKIESSLGSLFTKDDVKSVVSSLFEKVFDILNDVEPQQGSINLDAVNDAIRNAVQSFSFDDDITIDNPRFSVDYSNTIEIDSYEIEFNDRDLITHIQYVVKESVTESNVTA